MNAPHPAPKAVPAAAALGNSLPLGEAIEALLACHARDDGNYEAATSADQVTRLDWRDWIMRSGDRWTLTPTGKSIVNGVALGEQRVAEAIRAAIAAKLVSPNIAISDELRGFNQGIHDCLHAVRFAWTTMLPAPVPEAAA